MTQTMDMSIWPEHGYARVLVRARPSLIARLDRIVARPELGGASRNRVILHAIQCYVERVEKGGAM